MLEPEGFDVIAPHDIGLHLTVDEDGATFADNARKKAEAFCRASHLLTLADDSGIEVAALDGGPGIYSARFGGPGLDEVEKIALLLRSMQGVPWALRGARFVSVIAIAHPDGKVAIFEGDVYGVIANEPRGSNGFGYDPVFYYPPFGATFGEITEVAKASVSHRGKALLRATRYLTLLRDGAILGK